MGIKAWENKVSINTLWSNLFQHKSGGEEQAAKLWAKTPLFQDIPLAEIRRLVDEMIPRSYTAGEYIFHTGDQGAGAALILDGQVDIRSADVLLTQLQLGDFFGEIALALDVPRTADAVSVTDTRVLFFLQAGWEDWLTRAPYYAGRLSKNLANVLALRLMSANQSMVRSSGQPA